MKFITRLTNNGARHGVGLVMSIVRLVVEDKPLVLLSLPRIACLLVDAVFGVRILQIYTAEHRIVTNIALASAAFIWIGLFAVFTSITL